MLDLVLKTSNSARLVLLKNPTNTMPNDDDGSNTKTIAGKRRTLLLDDDGQDHMFRFILLKGVDRSVTFGEVATPNVLHDMTIR